TDDLQVMPDIPNGMVWTGDNTILISARREGGSGLYSVNLDSAEVETVHYHEATNSNFSIDDEQRYIVRGHTSFDNHGEISVFDRQQGSAKLVTNYSDS